MTMQNQNPAYPPRHETQVVKPLHEYVKLALEKYFENLDGQVPSNLYQLVLEEVEPPMLSEVMKYTRGNQSKAAIILGLSRGTLRKKLHIYGMD